MSRIVSSGIMQSQTEIFQRLLNHVWKRSAFFRDLYASHGIKEKDLAEVGVHDLPFITKEIVMDNFDAVVTDPRLKKKEIEDWLHKDRDPFNNYKNHFIVTHSSGSSGQVGITAIDQKAWRTATTAMAAHLPPPENYPLGKTSVAFYLVSHGHFGGVSSAARMLEGAYETLILSVLDPVDRIVDRLNAFQPQRLHGYASTISTLAELALKDSLDIRPQSIVVSGDKLTVGMEQAILEAWHPRIYNIYSASESKCIAVKGPLDNEMTVLYGLNIIEVLDGNNRPVPSGGEGRVVLTNLFNYTFPSIRYELKDYVVVGATNPDGSVESIRDIRGRAEDNLPIVLADGRQDYIHGLVLTVLYAPGLAKIQFISVRPDFVRIDYVADRDVDATIREEFQRLLGVKKALRTTFEVRRVHGIANDPHTGKLRLVKIEHGRTNGTAATSAASSYVEARENGAAAVRLLDGIDRKFVERSVPECFEEQAARYSNTIAVKTRNFSLTYEALNSAANRVARAIIEKCGPGEEPIVLVFDDHAPMIVSMLGVWKTGKICVVLDPSYTQARAGYVMDDSQAKFVVTNHKNIGLAREYARPTQELLNIDEIDPDLSAKNLALTITPDAFACIIYTSGSTGQPKGVVQNHRNVIHNAMRYATGCRIGASDRVTLLASLGTGQGMPTAFSALLSGATLYPFQVKNDGVAPLGPWLVAEEITVYISAPTLFRHFVATLTGKESFPNLRVIRLGAEQIRKSDVDLYKTHFSHCTLALFLSATEAGNICQYFIDRETEIANDIVPVGYAAPDMEVLLLDDQGQHVGAGEMGEIIVRSRYLSPGYWRMPEATKAVFQRDPKGGERIYRTGDIGRVLPGGLLEHLGRKDFLVKIRGYRVDITEIETVLLQYHRVQEAIVRAVDRGTSEKQLAAYVLPAGPAPSVSDLRGFLLEKLPDYMIPSAFIILDELPLTPIGKLDRMALPIPDSSRPQLDVAYAAPRHAVEEKLVRLWEEILDVRPVGIHDNFFDLGGHSLTGATLISRLNRTFGMDMAVGILFEAPTIAQMTALVENGQGASVKSNSLASAVQPTYLFELQPGRDDKRVFFFPGGGGSEPEFFVYANLARHVGMDYSFYGLRARGADGKSEPHRGVEEMAADYIQAIRTVQPHGPYLLVGECIGGIAAYEVARQLKTQGEKIGLLILMDTQCPNKRIYLKFRIRRLLRPLFENYYIRRISVHWENCRDLDYRKKIPYLFQKLVTAFCFNSFPAQSIVSNWAQAVVKVHTDKEMIAHINRIRDRYRRILCWHNPKPYEGRVHILINEKYHKRDQTLGWRRLALKGLDIHKTPGNHDSYIREHVKTTAQELKVCLDSVSNAL